MWCAAAPLEGKGALAAPEAFTPACGPVVVNRLGARARTAAPCLRVRARALAAGARCKASDASSRSRAERCFLPRPPPPPPRATSPRRHGRNAPSCGELRVDQRRHRARTSARERMRRGGHTACTGPRCLPRCLRARGKSVGQSSQFVARAHAHPRPFMHTHPGALAYSRADTIFCLYLATAQNPLQWRMRRARRRSPATSTRST